MKTSGKQWPQPSLPRLPRYNYQPLRNEDDIRLVRLRSQPNGRISLSLGTYPLRDNCPSFLCLSYTWGPPNIDDERSYQDFITLECDGRSITVTRNLYDALVLISRKYSSINPLLWVDALCINQQDLNEKCHQIQLMRNIFKQASIVIAWLGQEDKDVPDFAAAMERLEDHIGRRISEANPASLFPGTFTEGLDSLFGADWAPTCRAYFSFYHRRRYFRRAWIVQEIAIAKRLKFFCGQHALDHERMRKVGLLVRWSGFRHIVASMLPNFGHGGVDDIDDRLLQYRQQVACGGPEDKYSKSSYVNIDGAVTAEQRWVAFFQYMVQELRRYQSADPRDRVYSCLGLFDLLKPDSVLRTPLVPDYTAPTIEVYMRATELFLAEIPYLSTLSYIEDRLQRTVPRYPSWVPDYQVPLCRPPFTHLCDGTLFEASGPLDPMTMPRDRTFQLTCGKRLLMLSAQQISSSVTTTAGLDNVITSHNLFPLLLLMMKYMSSTYEYTDQPRIEALWRTMIADTAQKDIQDEHPAAEAYEKYFREWVLHMLNQHFALRPKWTLIAEPDPMSLFDEEHIAQLHELRNVGEKLITSEQVDVALERYQDGSFAPLFGDKEYSGSEMSSNALLFDRAFRRMQPSRALFSTLDGHLGVGPESCLRGDQIWLIQGSRVPFILRPAKLDDGTGVFEIVGEAYVHGVMHGEAVGREGAEWESIRIM